MAKAHVFKRERLEFKPAITPSGNTSIARVIGSDLSSNLGAGLEVLENVTIDWTVTYGEVRFAFEVSFIVEFDGKQHVCNPGDIVWLPQGTQLKYIARERAAYFYALYPVDWARRQSATHVEVAVHAFNRDARRFYENFGFSSSIDRLVLKA